jgi:hypothetical protein
VIELRRARAIAPSFRYILVRHAFDVRGRSLVWIQPIRVRYIVILARELPVEVGDWVRIARRPLERGLRGATYPIQPYRVLE